MKADVRVASAGLRTSALSLSETELQIWVNSRKSTARGPPPPPPPSMLIDRGRVLNAGLQAWLDIGIARVWVNCQGAG